MNYLTILVFVALIAAYVVLSFFQLKKLKGKVVQIMEGKLENKQLSKLINRARASSKNQFSIYLCISGVKFSIIFLILFIPLDLLINTSTMDFNISKYVIIFLLMVIGLSINGIAKANSIWKLSN